MADIRAPDYELAERDYMLGMKYKEIAEKYGVSINTVKSWKQRYNWNRKGMHTKKEKVCTQKERPQKKKDKEVIEKLEDADLTEKQCLFCLYYIKSFNATMAAIKAGYAPDSAHAEGSRLLRNVKVAAEIRRLKGTMQEEIFVDAMDVLNKYIKIAFADVTDYLSFGQREVPVMGPFGPIYEGEGDDKQALMKTVNFVDFKDSTFLDGTILSEVKQGKDGASIKLADKMKALEKLEKYFDLFPDKFKRRIEEEKLSLAKLKVNEQEEEIEDDGFLDALKGEVSEVWDDAEED